MNTPFVKYVFSSPNLSNPDGSLPVSALNVGIVAGPGITSLGELPNALNFRLGSQLTVNLPKDAINDKAFCARILFKADAAPSFRENLLEGEGFPFSMFIAPGANAGEFVLTTTVGTNSVGWSGTSTRFALSLMPNVWYLADLIFDTDTVAVAIDGIVRSVHAFPDAALSISNAPRLFVGTWVDGQRDAFAGSIAAVELHAGIPPELEAQVDALRASPEWFISRKYEAIRPALEFGEPTGPVQFDYVASAHAQRYERGCIMFVDTIGAAFELHGAIWQRYESLPNRSVLGYLVSDEGNAGILSSRKSLFQRGGIYWSSATGAIEVLGQMYLDYEHMGEAKAIGLPTVAQRAITQGFEQEFQRARMFHKTGAARAHEVHGAILARFLAIGSTAKWGFPVSNEEDVRNGRTVLGRMSDFEACSVYWSASTGAWEVYGDIRTRYQSLKGPLSQLGFPTSGEADIPNAAAPARYNTFQKGSILWFGSESQMHVCYPFKIFLKRVNSVESEGFGQGQNDLYVWIRLRDNGQEIHSERFPRTGDFSGRNIVDFNQSVSRELVTNDANRRYDLSIDVWDADSGFGGGDDHLGKHERRLDMANAWGLRDNNGVLRSGRFAKINDIEFAVQPSINVSALTEIEKWWGVSNRGTPVINYSTYASAFRDVDSDTEWWDVTDWLDKAFYQLVTKSLAKNGNCFGMSLESIYARKQRSQFAQPLNAFTNWATLENEFNVKQQYQVGAQAIWWFVSQLLTGNTHDPVDVFNASHSAFLRGDNPVLSVSQNYDFSGKPHAILPVAWDKSSTPWRITICDPNSPGALKTLFVDPNRNEFSYAGSANYSGGEWSGGRLHYMPYSVLNVLPRTPVWDAILLLLSGTIIIVGDGAQTTSLTNAAGEDLNRFSNASIESEKAGRSMANKFVSFKGFDAGGDGALASEMHFNLRPSTRFTRLIPRGFDEVSDVTPRVRDLVLNNPRRSPEFGSLADRDSFARISGFDIKSVLANPDLVATLSPGLREVLKQAERLQPIGRTLRHTVVGTRDVESHYVLKRAFNHLSIRSQIKADERDSVHSDDLGMATQVTKFITTRDKRATVELGTKLGAQRDHIKVTMIGLPVESARELVINPRPGLAAIDVISAGVDGMAQVTIDSRINGEVGKRVFNVPLGGGVRIDAASAIHGGSLRAATIDTVMGPSLKTIQLAPQ
jgi:hypothetical protein